MNNEPVAWTDGQFYVGFDKTGICSIPLYTHPAKTPKDREADRKRFSDEAFNRWLDESITDSGHTVYDLVENVCEAWHGWENSQYYKPAKTLTDELKALLYSVNGDAYLGKEKEESLVAQVRKQYTEPAKTLTDEEIHQIFRDESGFEIDTCPIAILDFARAILRKAQEK